MTKLNYSVEATKTISVAGNSIKVFIYRP
uniref:Uncharacterized protein n=1 Tax=Anguilla anguilla TaxID=7936 RepID=A0A0E9QBE4_ANGAN